MSADNMTCSDPIDNCDSDPSEYVIDPISGIWICPQCHTGFSWGWSSFNSGACMCCGELVDNCYMCDVDGTCSVCDEGFTPSPNGDFCQPVLENCDYDPKEYVQIAKWNEQNQAFTFFNKCPQCNEGFYWIEDADFTKEGCYGNCSTIDPHCSLCSIHGD